jgi:hypothetical protein
MLISREFPARRDLKGDARGEVGREAGLRRETYMAGHAESRA